MIENMAIQTAIIGHFSTDNANNAANSTPSRAQRCGETKKSPQKLNQRSIKGFAKPSIDEPNYIEELKN
jgi:hypothetical protein